MPYSDREYKDTNVNYLNKDFLSLKNSLVEYAKTYFPNSYKDFNETSTGMMLIEMSAYVGDVMSFYIDQQYREMLLPLAEERRNVVNIARMLGYKVKPIVPAFTTLKLTQTVDATGDNDARVPDFDTAVTIDKGLKVTSTGDTDIIFETLSEVDFKITGSITWEESARDSDDITSTFDLISYVRAVSGETKTKAFTVGTPTKFLELIIPDTNVIEILSIYDSNNNKWYEVDYLAQDRIPLETHYASDDSRNSSFDYNTDGSILTNTIPVEYSLKYIQTSKRFITQVNDDNTTSLVFGNGILRNGQTVGSAYLDTEQVGITIPGTTGNLDASINDLLGDEYDTLGETPAHTTLTVSYRVGGGLASNVAAGDLTSIGTPTYIGSPSSATLAITNEGPAVGGANQQSVSEIRERAKAHFTTQNRCVTKEDFEARTLSMPAKFGNIAKVYVNRINPTQLFNNIASLAQWECPENGGNFLDVQACNDACFDSDDNPVNCTQITGEDALISVSEFQTLYNAGGSLGQTPSIELYTLAYNNSKNLVRLSDNDNTAHIIHQNLKEYLSNYRMITDEIVIKSGYIVNFGVVFDVTAHIHANKQAVKLACMRAIIDYFDIDKMHFRQPIYIGQLQYELMGIDGVRSVNHVTVTQDVDNATDGTSYFSPGLYTYEWDPDGGGGEGTWTNPDMDGDGSIDDGYAGSGQLGYGYYFDFGAALTTDGSAIMAPATPAVFELKNPNENVIGVVR